MLDPVLTSRTKGLQLFYNLKLTPGRLLLGMADFEGSNYIKPGKGSILTLKARGKQARSPDLQSLCLRDAMFIDMNAKILETRILNGCTPSGGPQSAPSAVDSPARFTLTQNYPNPFSFTTAITYTLPTYSHVTLRVYDISGQKIRMLVDGNQAPGFHCAQWDGTDEVGNQMASGIYFYRLSTEEFTAGKKMILFH